MKRGLVLIALILSLGLVFAQGTEPPAKPQLVEKSFFKHKLRTPFEAQYHEWKKHQFESGFSIHPTISFAKNDRLCAEDAQQQGMPHARCVIVGIGASVRY